MLHNMALHYYCTRNDRYIPLLLLISRYIALCRSLARGHNHTRQLLSLLVVVVVLVFALLLLLGESRRIAILQLHYVSSGNAYVVDSSATRMPVFYLERKSQQQCCLHGWLGDRLGCVGNGQQAAARTRRGMRPSVPRVVSPTPSTHGARQS